MPPVDRLLLDLDGTFSDPLVGIERSLNHALTRFGYAPLPPGGAAPWIGPPLHQSLGRLTGRTARADVMPLVAAYRERYGDVGYAENTLYPGVAEALHALAARGVSLAVCTSKRRDFAVRILAHFDLLGLFEFVDGGDVGVHKAQQMAALRAAGRIGPATLMTGDRAVDVSAARASSLACAAVAWGYGSRAELAEAAPLCVLEAPAQWLDMDYRACAPR